MSDSIRVYVSGGRCDATGQSPIKATNKLAIALVVAIGLLVGSVNTYPGGAMVGDCYHFNIGVDAPSGAYVDQC